MSPHFVSALEYGEMQLEEGPTCFETGTCGENGEICDCAVSIEHRLSMMTSSYPILVCPNNGSLYRFDDK